VAPLRLGNNAYNNSRFAGYMSGFALSDVVRSNFSYGQFGAITTEPTSGAAGPISQPVPGTADLTVTGVTTLPGPGGGLLVQATVQNVGTVSTQNGFTTDLYVNHLPTGVGDYVGSVHSWTSDPIPAGGSVTLSTVLADLGSTIPAGSEVTGTIHVQVDSGGWVNDVSRANNISAATTVCMIGPDSFEPNNTAAAAKPIGLAEVQRHNIHGSGDQDWMSFTAQVGQTYRIRTFNLAASADTELEVYGPDGVTLLASNGDFNGTLASQLDWAAPAPGTYYIRIRHWNPNAAGCATAYDIELSASPISVTPVPLTPGGTLTPGVGTGTPATPNPGVNCPCSIWTGAGEPVNSYFGAAAEIGVKFRSSLPGAISAVRFYKVAGETGPRAVNLWSRTGTLLGTANSSGESGSGWQQVSFAAPVPIEANTTYIASYYSHGGFAYDLNFFTATGVMAPPLELLRSGVDGPNAVYAYSGTSVFPTSTFQDANYGVDVVFISAGQVPTLTATSTVTQTVTVTPLPTLTPSLTATATQTPTVTRTLIPTVTPTQTVTLTPTPTPTETTTLTPTPAPTETVTATVTPT
jgi:hypothetical protein